MHLKKAAPKGCPLLLYALFLRVYLTRERYDLVNFRAPIFRVVFVPLRECVRLKLRCDGLLLNRARARVLLLHYNVKACKRLFRACYELLRDVEKVVVSGSLVYADKQNDTTVENGNFTLGNAGTDSSSKPWIFNIHGKNEGNFIKINGGTYNQDLLMNYDTKRDCEVVLSDDCYLKELAGLYTVTKNDEE